jgi:parallel beta-helix repeat protein
VNGKKLIIRGSAIIEGTEEDKLTFDFVSPLNDNGIVIEEDATLVISNCIVKNAETGILAELDAYHLDARYVDFEDCESSSISILGQSGTEQFSPPPPFLVKYCTLSSPVNGISASNLSELIIQENTITNTEMGIFLSNVTGTTVMGNVIISDKEELPGIFAESMSGGIRTNIIEGHTNGIHLGNSSPDVGGNRITANKYHGMYIGSGSYPNMEGYITGSPPVFILYPVTIKYLKTEDGKRKMVRIIMMVLRFISITQMQFCREAATRFMMTELNHLH